MVKIGLWIELQVALGFIIGLGFGSLTGQRTVSVIVLVALQIIVTPTAGSSTVIPYFLNGQRLLVGVAMEQLRPAALFSVKAPAITARAGPSWWAWRARHPAHADVGDDLA